MQPVKTQTRRAPRRQRGLSLVELMVGMAVGLFVVAGASFVVASQLSDNRRLLLETQLQQDLRAAVDIMTREIRRAGAEQPETALWVVGGDGLAFTPTQRTAVTLAPDGTEIGFAYVRETPAGPWGFKVENGTIRTRLADGNWQDLTDRNTAEITQFRIVPTVTEQVLPCPVSCNPADPNDTSCWPKLTQRAYEIFITGRAVFDARVERSLRSVIRLRNDMVASSPALPAGAACP